MRILIAEDDKISEILMINYLKEFGECVPVENGKKALDLYIEAFEKDPFDLICLDIMMPIMTGQEALAKIREFEDDKNIIGLARVKIIMVTALDQRDEVMKAFKTGCESYLVKPISKKDIKKALKDLELL